MADSGEFFYDIELLELKMGLMMKFERKVLIQIKRKLN